MSESLHTFCRRHDVNIFAVDRRIMELRDLGMSFSAIAKAVSYYEGWPLSKHQVRGRLNRMGAPKNPNKVRVPA